MGFNLLEAGEKLKEELVDELRLQGHIHSGKLADMQVVVAREGDLLTAKIYMEEYGLIVDKGVKASRVPYGKGIGDFSKFIAGLEDRFGSLESAFKIARSMAFYDSPTPGSFAFSQNGERTDFIGRTIIKTKVLDDITRIIVENIDSFIQKQLQDV